MENLGKSVGWLIVGSIIILQVNDSFAKTYDEKKAEALAIQRAKRIETETKYQSCIAACTVKNAPISVNIKCQKGCVK